MSQGKQTLAAKCSDELHDEVEEIREEGGYEHRSDAVRELLDRGVDSWRREHTEYPASEMIANGVRVSAVAVVVGSPVAIALKDGVAYQSVAVLAATMAAFLVAHTAGVVWARWAQ